jgi:hypothetical protein
VSMPGWVRAQTTDPGALNAKAKNAATPRNANATR